MALFKLPALGHFPATVSFCLLFILHLFLTPFLTRLQRETARRKKENKGIACPQIFSKAHTDYVCIISSPPLTIITHVYTTPYPSWPSPFLSSVCRSSLYIHIEEYINLSQCCIDRTINEWRPRLEKVIEKRGRHTEHLL